MRLGLSAGMVGVFAVLGAPSWAGTVVGRLELPAAPDRPVISRGFLDRTENPLADITRPSLAPYLVVALDGDARSEAAPAQVTWDLVGDSFSRPVIAVPVGAEVVIRNLTSFARTIAAAEDPQLIVGPLNPTGTKSFRARQPAIYTFGDKDASHLKGKIVVVATRHVASLDDAGRFELLDVPEGSYKLRVFFYDPSGEARGGKSDWLPFSVDVVVAPRGKATKPSKTEVTARLPALPAAPVPVPGKR
jgi:hypothetical protein